jgi:hypothetical protein
VRRRHAAAAERADVRSGDGFGWTRFWSGFGVVAARIAAEVIRYLAWLEREARNYLGSRCTTIY